MTVAGDRAVITSRRGRVLARVLRFIPRFVPLKGWTVLTEGLHPHIVNGATDVIHRTPDGFQIHLDLEDYIQRCIFYDAWESSELAFMRAVVRPRDVVLDVGANIGIFSLVAAQALKSTGEVHAFEPVPANFERLSENVRINSFSNVVVNQAAVGAASGMIELALEPELEAASGKRMSGMFSVGSGLRHVTAPVLALDDYARRRLGERRIRLAKIDVEGYEPHVLEGMQHLLGERRIDFILIEVSAFTLPRAGFKVKAVVDPLLASGYRLYRLEIPGLAQRWSYRGEPSQAERRPGKRSFVATVRMGLQDLGRHFNLLAVRGDLASVARNPSFVRISRLRNDKAG